MKDLMDSIMHWRTTLPGVGVFLLAIGHWWTSGEFKVEDLMALLTAFGFVAVQKPTA